MSSSMQWTGVCANSEDNERHDAAYWVAKNWTRLSDGTTTIITVDSILISNFIFTDLILTSKMLIFFDSQNIVKSNIKYILIGNDLSYCAVLK